MRRRGFTIWQAVIILALVAIAAMILFPIFFRAREGRPSSCQSQLKQLGLGFAQYLQDYDERYPLVNVNDSSISENNPLGWADALYPYLKENRLFWCPEKVRSGQRDVVERKPSDRDFTDYFFNRRLVGIEEKKIKSLPLTIMLGEGNDGTDAANARYSLSTLPQAWITNMESPLHRHFEGSNFAYADGHVKYSRAGTIKTLAIQ